MIASSAQQSAVRACDVEVSFLADDVNEPIVSWLAFVFLFGERRRERDY